MSRLTNQKGFTLVEVLVAAALIGVVMAMAMQAFMGLTRISNLARSRMIAASEASKGVHSVAALLRRAHVIYFTGKPIATGQTVDNAGDLNTFRANLMSAATFTGLNDPPVAPVPNVLGASGPVPGPAVQYAFGAVNQPLGNAFMQAIPRGRFRFWDWGGTGGVNPANTLVGNAQRLQTSEPVASGMPYDRYFPSPLLYIGEATFATDATDGQVGSIGDMYMPVSWTFYVVYLAPMDVGANAVASPPSWTSTQRPMDRGPWGTARSTIPFELRCLTVPGVRSGTGNPMLHQNYQTPNGVTEYLDAPFDYAPGTVNYDPIPVTFSLDAAKALQTAQTTNRGALGTVNGSGARVAGAHHDHYGKIGNDPPNQQALSTRLAGAPPITDKVLASWVDPDSVHGTCVRLLNTIGLAPGLPNAAENAHPPRGGFGEYRRYLNAYGGEYLYNHYRSVVVAGGVPDYSVTGLDTGPGIPKRALVSIATRYRNDSRVDFQYASDQIEIDLENLVRYQSINRRSR
jgi:prepilin-type N-terminal cleavage/methylation domain-containing protein